MSSLLQTSREEEFYKLAKQWGVEKYCTFYNPKYDLVIYDDVVLPNKEETPMKKHFAFAGSGAKFDTRADAEKAAKKYLDTMNKNYGANSDIAIYEAVACVTFPTPAYEVVELAAATSS